MAKWWMGLALLAMAIGSLPASAQPPSVPEPGGPAAMPEPIPVVAPPTGGPTPPQPAPSSGLTLPADLPNAWDHEKHEECPACYGSVGYLTLQRQRLGQGAAAVVDPGNGVHVGSPPPANAPLAADFDDIDMRLNHGVRTTFGYHWDHQALELGGFYLSQSSSATVIANRGRLDSFFNINGNFNNAPLGFEGDNGMWLQADLMRLRLQTALGSGEVNYRCWPLLETGWSGSLGVRYLDVYERFSFFTGDDDLTAPDPRRQSTYSTTTHNRIVAPQLGCEYNRAISCWLAFSATAKGAWGANFLDTDVHLKRGDGFMAPSGHRSETIFSHLYEMGFFLDFRLHEHARLRAGYNLLWVVDVAEAVGQLDFNLANQAGQRNNHGNIFYHGPSVELHFMF
jgi:hypothetical protein